MTAKSQALFRQNHFDPLWEEFDECWSRLFALGGLRGDLALPDDPPSHTPAQKEARAESRVLIARLDSIDKELVKRYGKSCYWIRRQAQDTPVSPEAHAEAERRERERRELARRRRSVSTDDLIKGKHVKDLKPKEDGPGVPFWQ